MKDLIVALYSEYMRAPSPEIPSEKQIRQAMAWDRDRLLALVAQQWPGWCSEVDLSMARWPVACVLALRGQDIVGFAAWDSVAPGLFGPMGVVSECRNQGLGRKLLLEALWIMKVYGYPYAIISGVEKAEEFYRKNLILQELEGSGFWGRYQNSQ